LADSRIGLALIPGAATESEVAVAAFTPLLEVLAEIPDPRRAEGKLYKLPHVLLFSILAAANCRQPTPVVGSARLPSRPIPVSAEIGV
jgi:hypothetical protein